MASAALTDLYHLLAPPMAKLSLALCKAAAGLMKLFFQGCGWQFLCKTCGRWPCEGPGWACIVVANRWQRLAWATEFWRTKAFSGQGGTGAGVGPHTAQRDFLVQQSSVVLSLATELWHNRKLLGTMRSQAWPNPVAWHKEQSSRYYSN